MNKVILIGGDHHNGLGLARSFGINGIKPYGIIVTGRNKHSFISKSKYWEKIWLVENEECVVKLLLELFSKEKERPVIIPWSDSIAAAIDLNLNRLRDFFIVPSLNGRQGAIVEMMDKQNQVQFLEKHNLPMAKTYTIDFPYFGNGSEFIYPCICKPVSSYEGQKTDIKKCDSLEAIKHYFGELESKGYKRILVQEYISFDNELEFVGSCGDDPAYIISDNVREWPVIGGTNSFLHILNDKSLIDVCLRVLDALRKESYFGMFDVELFKVGGNYLVNEINWRNTGNSFFALGTGVHYAVIWYLNSIGEDASNIRHFTTDTNQYAMNEATDLRHVVFDKLSFSEWFKDLRKTQSFALWYGKDLKPTINRYLYLIKELVLHRHNG